MHLPVDVSNIQFFAAGPARKIDDYYEIKVFVAGTDEADPGTLTIRAESDPKIGIGQPVSVEGMTINARQASAAAVRSKMQGVPRAESG